MPTKPSTAVVAPALVLILVALVSPPEATFTASGLGSGSTVAVSYATATVCGIVAGERAQRIQCYRGGQSVRVQYEVSYEAIAGGESFFCGLRSGGLTLLCWDTGFSNPASFHPKRIYHSQTDRLADLTVGDTQVCASKNNTGAVKCWRGGHLHGDGGEQSFPSPSEELKFSVITSGRGFSCGILIANRRVVCWGDRGIGNQIQREFSDFSMSTLMAGENHACGLNTSGVLICRGNNDAGQLDVPSNSPPFVYSGLALGAYHTCAIRRRNGLPVCWGWSGGGGGGGRSGSRNSTDFTGSVATNVSLESIVAGLNFTCGIKTRSLTLVCWGPGWPDGGAGDLPLPMVIPGPCVEASCTDCGVYPNSGTLCYGWGLICKTCDTLLPLLLPLPTNPPRLPPLPRSSDHVPTPSPARGGGNHSLVKAFAAVGVVGAFSGICVAVYVLWIKLGGGVLHLLHTQAVYGSAESTSRVASGDGHGDGDFEMEALGSAAAMKRQRSGPSWKHAAAAERARKFGLEELSAATRGFSPQHKIGSGSFGSVYRGTLADGRVVAIKRRETCARKREFQDKEAAFDAEVALLSRLHHKHLVGLVGFCNEEEERLLVYEYMSNGSLYSHLHAKWNRHKTSSVLNSWNTRIKVALDAARGIEYLHSYAVPPIIHRDIKSSNILLDANWTGKVSDFGLSLMRPESCADGLSPAPTRAVGTVGYIDPESYVLNVLTTKSDVYGLGVVLLELLTGKRAVFKNEDDGDGSVPMGVVEYAVPRIAAEEVEGVLDPRIGPPTAREAEAVELVAYTAMHCVNLEVRERPTMTDIVAILERALASCEDSHGHASTMSTTASFSFYDR